ncbi:MAG: YbhB/YbcL family Raf kinase inhibitor-like protein [Methanomicrobiaceae archaeon]|nr:YbhB/YbcL family Raf kinase inhibitor-like protein [Methanomicrobiaceae archaeon]
MEKLTVLLPFVELPPEHTCDGGDVSPPLELRGLRAESVAIVALNPFEQGCSFATWIIWNLDPLPFIPRNIPKVPVVDRPLRALQGTNDFGEIGYRGPCPPPGESHRLLFKGYGLDGQIDLEPGASKHAFIDALKGHVVQFGTTIAMYTR